MKNEILRRKISKPLLQHGRSACGYLFGKYFDDRGVVLQTENEGIAHFWPKSCTPLRCYRHRNFKERPTGRFMSSA